MRFVFKNEFAGWNRWNSKIGRTTAGSVVKNFKNPIVRIADLFIFYIYLYPLINNTIRKPDYVVYNMCFT